MKTILKNILQGFALATKPYPQPDIDICTKCGEHAEFDEDGSNCCGAGPINTDIDLEDR